MNRTFFKELLECPVFDRFPESLRKTICEIILRVATMVVEAMTAEGVRPEVSMEVEGSTPEVAPTEILAEVSKSPRSPRPRRTLTKEGPKKKKGKQVTTPQADAHIS